MTATRRRVFHILGGLNPSGIERMPVSAAPYWQAGIIGQGSDHPFAENLTAAGYNVNYVRSLRTTAGLAIFARLIAGNQTRRSNRSAFTGQERLLIHGKANEKVTL